MPLTSRLNKFNEKYGVMLDLDAIEQSERFFDAMEGFKAFRKPQKQKQGDLYYKILSQTLEASLALKTQINEKGEYDLSKFNLAEFIHDFEDIIDVRNRNSQNPRDRKPLEGIKFDSILSRLKTESKAYDCSIDKIWANKILNNDISYLDLKQVTERSIATLDAAKNAEEVDRGALANIVYACEAMAKVREQRGFFWKLFHLVDNSREGDYFETLQEKLAGYMNEGYYSISEIAAQAPTSMMAKVYENTDRTMSLAELRTHDEKKTMYQKVKAALDHEEKSRINQEAKVNEVKKEEERRVISCVAEKMQPVVEDPATKSTLVSEISAALPPSQWSKKVQSSILSNVTSSALINEAQSANESFDEGVRLGVEGEKQMLNTVSKVFAKAYMLSSSLGYNDPQDQLVAAQVMTDIVLKKLSPAALEPEKYEKFTKGYVLNNPKEFANVIDMDITAPAFVGAQKTYDEMTRENVVVPDANSQPVNNNKSAPVDPSKSIAPPEMKID